MADPPRRLYANLLQQIRHHDQPGGGLWAVRLQRRAGQPARGLVMGDRHRQRRHRVFHTGRLRAQRVSTSCPCCWTARRHIWRPGATHAGYPLALAVSALFGSNRADVSGAEEKLCRRAAEAQRSPSQSRVACRGDHLRGPSKHRSYYRRVRRRRRFARLSGRSGAGWRRPC